MVEYDVECYVSQKFKIKGNDIVDICKKATEIVNERRLHPVFTMTTSTNPNDVKVTFMLVHKNSEEESGCNDIYIPIPQEPNIFICKIKELFKKLVNK